MGPRVGRKRKFQVMTSALESQSQGLGLPLCLVFLSGGWTLPGTVCPPDPLSIFLPCTVSWWPTSYKPHTPGPCPQRLACVATREG